MLERYAEQILKAYNHIDTFIVTDKNGIIEYYVTFRPDVNTNVAKKLIGKHVLDAWSKDITRDTSTIMRVLETGEAVLDEYQEFHYGDLVMPSMNTTLPIKEHDRIVGTATMIRYLLEPFARTEITIDKIPGVYEAKYTLDDIKGVSESIQYLKEKIKMVAGSDSSVLIYGETGTGKELVAQSLHNLSSRAEKKFVSQNCAAIPENLLESILFGSVKGAYTGAENTPGLFEVAKGGTLFLDEINSMPLSMQAKILKAIEEKQVTRIGGHNPISTDVRIITAVNERPLDILKNGIVRKDLFYRLSVVEIDIEPLRNRPEDLEYMISHYITSLNKKMNRAILGLSDDVYALFRAYDWPGNVRELKNVLEGAFNVATSRTIEKKYLPSYLFSYGSDARIKSAETVPDLSEDFSLDQSVSEYEKNLLLKALEKTKNMSDAARLLGISKQTLSYKLQKYRIGK
ncbi:MAG: sigma 54-interacting transcriptional regulator [Clostridia bacterium]|nr:sigma 54-interacting transcriptional regulator [Clostridia bacterium]